MNFDSPSKPRGPIPGKDQFIWPVNSRSLHANTSTFSLVCIAHLLNDAEDPYPSLSDFHDYEPNLEFDDTELQQPAEPGGEENTCYS